jgi:uncharacterized OB-fold protein
MDLSAALDAVPFAERPRMNRETGRLVGSKCANCGAVSWPARPVCQRCGDASAIELELSDEGTLITFTEVWVPRTGLPSPYVLGQLDLVDGVRLFAHGRAVTSDMQVPMPVRLVLNEVPDVVPPFYFEPRETA